MEALTLTKKIVKILDSKKAEDIKVIGIKDLTIIGDYFIIASGNNAPQIKSLADEVDFQIGQEGLSPKRVEGYANANWVVLDYADVIVHIFYGETRDFYQLERLWADGEHLDVDEMLK